MRRVLGYCAGCLLSSLVADWRSLRPLLQVDGRWAASICRMLLVRVEPAWRCQGFSRRHGLRQYTSPGTTLRVPECHMLEGSFWQGTRCVLGSPDASAAGSCCQPAVLRALPAPERSTPCARESPTAVPADTMGALVARTTAGLIELSPAAWGVSWPAGGSCV